MTALSILAQESDGGGSGVVSLLVLLLIPFAMYFLLIRPQRKRMKETAAVQASLGVGDEVITSSGVYGFITGEEGDLFWLEIDDDVQIRIAKAAVQGKVGPAATTNDNADDDDDDDDDETSVLESDDEADSTS